MKRKREYAATLFQGAFRRYKARVYAELLRLERDCAITIQRVYRGHIGRLNAAIEADKYVFSKNQSQGIEFGRQMLVEHKLLATKLQSEISLLAKEKVNGLKTYSVIEDTLRLIPKQDLKR